MLKNTLLFANEKLEQQKQQNQDLTARVKNNSEEIEQYKSVSRNQLSQIEHLEKNVRLPSNRVPKLDRKESLEVPLFSKIEDEFEHVETVLNQVSKDNYKTKLCELLEAVERYEKKSRKGVGD